MVTRFLGLLISLILLFLPSNIYAQVVINEFSSADTSDWVEIYNTDMSSVGIDLSLYKLEDGDGNTKDLDGLISPLGFRAFDWSNRLNNDGDTVRLVRISDNSVVNEIFYGEDGGICVPSGDQSIGKLPDGTGDFARLAIKTKEAANNTETVPCPTPSPTPEPTQTSTAAPTSTPTPTPTPTKTPTPTPTATPKPTKTPTPKPTTTSEVLSAQDQSTSSSGLAVNDIRMGLLDPSPSPLVESTKVGKIPTYTLIILVSGVIFLGLAGYSFFISKKKGYTISDGQKDQNSGI